MYTSLNDSQTRNVRTSAVHPHMRKENKRKERSAAKHTTHKHIAKASRRVHKK